MFLTSKEIADAERLAAEAAKESNGGRGLSVMFRKGCMANEAMTRAYVEAAQLLEVASYSPFVVMWRESDQRQEFVLLDTELTLWSTGRGRHVYDRVVARQAVAMAAKFSPDKLIWSNLVPRLEACPSDAKSVKRAAEFAREISDPDSTKPIKGLGYMVCVAAEGIGRADGQHVPAICGPVEEMHCCHNGLHGHVCCGFGMNIDIDRLGYMMGILLQAKKAKAATLN